MAKIRFDIQVLDGRHRPLRGHKARLRGQTSVDMGIWDTSFNLQTTADGTLTAEFDLPTELVEVHLDARGTVSAPTYYFTISKSGRVEHMATADAPADYVKIKGSRRDGDNIIVEAIVAFPRVRALTPAELPSGFSFPAQSEDILTPPNGPSINYDLDFGTVKDVRPDVYVFRLEHLDRPKLVAVAFRAGLNRADRPLLFFHHTLGQNDDYKNKAYPSDPVYFQLGFKDYLGDKRGMAYQVAASGKEVAMVLPLPQAGVGDNNEVGVFDSQPDVVEDVLEELAAYFDRRFRSNFGPVSLQNFAVGSYSSGILHLGKFLAAGGSLGSKITNVIDIDGSQSDYSKTYPPSTFAKKGRAAWTYNQQAVSPSSNQFKTLAGLGQFALPWDRWSKIPGYLPFGLKPKKAGAKMLSVLYQQQNWIHNFAMPQYCLYHALMMGSY